MNPQGMPDIHSIIVRSARALDSLAVALPQTAGFRRETGDAARAAERGYFTADEDERVRSVFARYLGIRAALHETITELEPVLDAGDLPRDLHLRVFTIAFCAACLLVRSARYLVDHFAQSKVVWRKLDEAEPRYGIPRKQFSSVYKSVTSLRNRWRFQQAVEFARDHMDAIRGLASCPVVGGVVALLAEEHPEAIRFSRRVEARNRLRYWLHSLGRRRKSTLNQVSFALFEASGRFIAELKNPLHEKRVTPQVVRATRRLLRPGDALVTRHDDAVSNLFLPGYWPHGALYLGSRRELRELGVPLSGERWQRSAGRVRVLEARKDGVRLRLLTETLRVDAFAVVRPRLSPTALGLALERAIEHEGKGYDFEFDFNRSDRLVCTEVIYRGFHGVGGLEFPLTSRVGRPTFSAEDLLDLAIEGRGYEVVAVYGENGNNRLLQGHAAHEALARTYREEARNGPSGRPAAP
ncbi:MAG: hypothetical protein H7A46_04970 [Verrucomicrobiales bacterium]|nr:hypothetical protein [Verrucomicrobiales bacterium]